MESLALQGAESVCVKTEPCEDVCLITEPSFDSVFIKTEISYPDACVKDEPSGEEVSVKAEPSDSNACIQESSVQSAAAAAAGLYADHVVKDELVLGPVLVEHRRNPCTSKGQPTQEEQGKHKPHSCDICGYTTSMMRAFVAHRRRHTSHKLSFCLYRCEHCNYISGKRSLLQKHLKIHTGVKPYKCGQCSYATAYEHGLEAHETIHTLEKRFKCGQCSYATARKANLRHHEKKHSVERPYKCNQCSYATPYKNTLKRHKTVHTGEKRFKCGQCSYATACNRYLRVHEKKHSEEIPYKCGQCSYATPYKHLLKVHETIHTGEKPNDESKCDLCRCDACISVLLYHKRFHTEVNPYNCSQCSYTSNRKNVLKVQENLHQPNNSGYVSNLIEPGTQHTGDKLYKCELSSYAGVSKSELRVHIQKTMHTYERAQEEIHIEEAIPNCDVTPICAQQLADHDHTYAMREPEPKGTRDKAPSKQITKFVVYSR